MIETVARWIVESKNTVIITGAGMSTESGIPDFRSSKGMWKEFNPAKVANKKAIEKSYDEFYHFYKNRVLELSKYEPHKGHDIIADLEGRGLVKNIFTQNVDGFHQRAGNKNVFEFHGNIYTFRCASCEKQVSQLDFLNREACSKCGQTRHRPNVVLFGENLPKEILEKAKKEIAEAELVIVIGTSLKVFPVSQLPKLTKGKKVLINYDKSVGFFAPKFDAYLLGTAGKILSSLHEEALKVGHQ